MKPNGKGDVRGTLRVILEPTPRPPAQNIALEEAISRLVARGTSPPTFRLWRGSPAAIVGRSQAAEAEVDLRHCRDRGLPVIRRPSGGGTVLHGPKNLNYSLYLPQVTNSNVLEEGLKRTEPLLEVLQKLGLKVEARKNGVFLGKWKLGGVAQSRRWGLLHHGTLLLGKDRIIEEMELSLRAGRKDYEKGEAAVASQPSPVVSLEELSSAGNLSLNRFCQDWVRAVAHSLNLRPKEGKLQPAELQLGERLTEEKYGRREWNLKGPKSQTQNRRSRDQIISSRGE